MRPDKKLRLTRHAQPLIRAELNANPNQPLEVDPAESNAYFDFVQLANCGAVEFLLPDQQIGLQVVELEPENNIELRQALEDME